MKSRQLIQLAFERVAKNRDFSLVDQQDLKDIALAVWHEGFVPQFQSTQVDAAVAGYLVDRLRRYPCVPQNSRVRLKLLVEHLRDTVGKFDSTSVPDKKLDSLARDWGLVFDLNTQLHELLPYQRRAYQHPRKFFTQ